MTINESNTGIFENDWKEKLQNINIIFGYIYHLLHMKYLMSQINVLWLTLTDYKFYLVISLL